MTKPTLVILAAGMGSRYGGMKQLESVGPSGETIMDYSIYDALRAGFGKAVFVIRPEMEEAFHEMIGSRYEKHIPVAYAFQRLDGLPAGFGAPAGRTKPWGTGHAVLAARDAVNEPFAVINADDFYGGNSFSVLGDFLSRAASTSPATYAMVGFTLRDTLTDAGSVNRGVCHCSPDGLLERIVETLNIARRGTDGRCVDADGNEQIIPGDSLVSMNTWGFTLDFFERLAAGFEHFLSENGESPKSEYHLPTGVQELMHSGAATVQVLPTTDTWCGVTHQEDKPRVVAMIRKLVDGGAYPEKLWA